MSLFTRVFGQIHAILGKHHSQVSNMQGNQNMIASLQKPTNLPVGSYLNGDKNFATGQATNNLEEMAYSAMQDSSKPKDKDFESFAYFT